MKFNSQICTTRSQSETLLKLGLKKETADMGLTLIGENEWIPFMKGDYIYEDDIPAWSLHRLLSLIPKEFEVNIVPMCGKNYRKWVCFIMNFDYNIIYFDSNYEDFVGFYEGDVYDKIIACIEWLIKEGYFNEGYLNNVKTE